MKNMLIKMLLDEAATTPATGTVWYETLANSIINILTPVLTLAAVAGIIYAIVVGVKFAKADDKAARDEAKQKLITVIIGIVVTLLLIALFFWVKTNISTWLTSLKTAI